MKKILFILLVLVLFSCNIYFRENEDVFVVSNINNDTVYNNYNIHIKLVRIPCKLGEINTIYLQTNDVNIKIGDKFKLTKIEE